MRSLKISREKHFTGAALSADPHVDNLFVAKLRSNTFVVVSIDENEHWVTFPTSKLRLKPVQVPAGTEDVHVRIRMRPTGFYAELAPVNEI